MISDLIGQFSNIVKKGENDIASRRSEKLAARRVKFRDPDFTHVHTEKKNEDTGDAKSGDSVRQSQTNHIR